MQQIQSSKLGPLEKEVMEVVWKLGETSLGKVYEVMSEKKDIAYTTVLTIMSRLSEKGLLKRHKVGRAYVYAPVMTEKQTIRELIRVNIDKFIDQFGQEAVAAFTDELEEINKSKRNLK